MSSWRFEYDSKRLKKDISKIDNTTLKRIKSAIETKLVRDPIAFSKPLRYSLSGQRSFRVGNYRVILQLDLDEKLIKITAIKHRKEVYS